MSWCFKYKRNLALPTPLRKALVNPYAALRRLADLELSKTNLFGTEMICRSRTVPSTTCKGRLNQVLERENISVIAEF